MQPGCNTQQHENTLHAVLNRNKCQPPMSHFGTYMQVYAATTSFSAIDLTAFVAQHTAKTEQIKRLTVLQRGESSPQVWSAVLGCLIHLVSHCGYIVRGYLEGLSLKVVAALMQCCLDHQWCDTVYCQLVRLLVNMMYAPTSSSQGESPSKFESGCSQVFVHSCSTTAVMALILTSKPAFCEPAGVIPLLLFGQGCSQCKGAEVSGLAYGLGNSSSVSPHLPQMQHQH